MTPTLGQEEQTFFQVRELLAYKKYTDAVKELVDAWDDVGWQGARDLYLAWQDERRVMHKADAATPCTHTAAERNHEAQRCDWCWAISTYVRLTTKEEDGNGLERTT